MCCRIAQATIDNHAQRGSPDVGGRRNGVIQINHVIVDEKKLIYAVDRGTGGLYILRYTGKAPFD